MPKCCAPVGDGARRVTTEAAFMKAVLRDAIVLAGVILLAPLWLAPWLERHLSRGDGWFAGFSELVSLVPGKPGVFVRRAFYRMTLDSCATDCHVGFGTTFAHPRVNIGKRVYIGNRCTVGLADIGDDATVGSNVEILSGRRQHHFDDEQTPIQRQGGEFRRVQLGRDCWVGNSAVVMADVGAGAVVGAAAVVVRPVPANAVVVGNPAAVKRFRGAAA